MVSRALLLVTALLLVCASPVAAAEPEVDLVVTAAYDRASYLSTEDATLTVTITNIGTATATGVVVTSAGDPTYPDEVWGAFSPGGPGGSVAPGAEVVLTATGRPFDPGDGISQSVHVGSAEPDRDEENNEARAEAGATDETCAVTVVLFGDEDRDGQFGAGEALVGVAVLLYSGGKDFVVRTDARGRAHFAGLPCGAYRYHVTLSTGWVAGQSENIKTRPGVTEEHVVKAVRNEAVALAATVALDRDSYALGDQVRERVTVTNRGPVEVTGIRAMCGHYGTENDLYSIGWGDLDPVSEQGLRLRAGETRSFEFTATVPPQAWDYGFVVLRCNFSISGSRDGTWAEDRAAVPGGRGSLAATLAHDDQAVPGVKVTLTDPMTGATAARAVTGADGHVQLPVCAAGEYELRLVGSWRFLVTTMTVQVFAGRNQDLGQIAVLPGPHQPDPDAAVPAPRASVPAAPAAARPVRPAELAETGVSVGVGFLVAALLLVSGGGLVLAGRRNCVR